MNGSSARVHSLAGFLTSPGSMTEELIAPLVRDLAARGASGIPRDLLRVSEGIVSRETMEGLLERTGEMWCSFLPNETM